VWGRYRFLPGEICDCSRYAAQTLVRPRRQVEALGRAFEERPAGVVNRANSCELLAFKSRIGAARAPYLQLPCLGNPLRNN